MAKDTWVDGHTRKDGTYVQGHQRSAPDNNPHNNYSAKGNTNPYTGKDGTVDSDNTYRQPSYQYRTPQPTTYGAPQKECRKDHYGNVNCD